MKKEHKYKDKDEYKDNDEDKDTERENKSHSQMLGKFEYGLPAKF